MGNIFHAAGLHNIINSLSKYPSLAVLFVATEVLESKKLTYFFFVSSHPKWGEECLSNEVISFAFLLGTSC